MHFQRPAVTDGVGVPPHGRSASHPVYVPVDQKKERKTLGEWTLGMILIILVSAIWAGCTVLVQYVYDDLGFPRPFSMTYVGSTLFGGYLPFYLALASLGLVRNPPLWTSRDEPGDVAKKEAEGSEGEDFLWKGVDPDPFFEESLDKLPSHSLSEESKHGGEGDDWDDANGLSTVLPTLKSHIFIVKTALALGPLWFLAQLSYGYSLAMTSNTSSTIIVSSGSVFTFGVSAALKLESYSIMKAIGVVLALVGAAMVSIGDSEHPGEGDSLAGDICALLSAVLFGLYAGGLRLGIPKDEEMIMPLLFGYIGLLNALIFLPVLVGLALSPSSKEFASLTWHVLGLMVVRGVAGNVVSSLLWARAVVLTTPTVASVGCSLTIPAAFATDYAIHGVVPSAEALWGAVLVTIGFVVVSIRGTKDAPLG